MLINGINIDISANGLFGSIYIGLFEMGITFFFWLKAMTLSENNSKIGKPCISFSLFIFDLNFTYFGRNNLFNNNNRAYFDRFGDYY